MKSALPAAVATIVLALIIVVAMPYNSKAEQDFEQDTPVPAVKKEVVKAQAVVAKAPVTKSVAVAARQKRAAKAAPSRGAIIAQLLKKHSQNRFQQRAFEGELALHLYKNPGDTLEAVELFLKQDDYQVAHAMARGIAGTLVNQAEARRRILDVLVSPAAEMIAEAALYTLLASHHHEDVQRALVKIFAADSRSERVRTAAAFVIREGLSSMQTLQQQKARLQARYILNQKNAPSRQISAAKLRVECIAILGGHLHPSSEDRLLLKSSLAQASQRDELEVALAMLIRHKTPKEQLISSLEKRIAQAQTKQERGMFQELKRKTLSALEAVKK
jgi:hypothetical protein